VRWQIWQPVTRSWVILTGRRLAHLTLRCQTRRGDLARCSRRTPATRHVRKFLRPLVRLGLGTTAQDAVRGHRPRRPGGS
jgi:hypothetical protein